MRLFNGGPQASAGWIKLPDTDGKGFGISRELGFHERVGVFMELGRKWNEVVKMENCKIKTTVRIQCNKVNIENKYLQMKTNILAAMEEIIYFR